MRARVARGDDPSESRARTETLVMTATTTDRTAANLATVGAIYTAFSTGDVPTILDTIAEDCRWESWTNNHAQRHGVPWLQPRVGPAGVGEFFADIAELQITDFQVHDMVAGERQVAVEVTIEF